MNAPVTSHRRGPAIRVMLAVVAYGAVVGADYFLRFNNLISDATANAVFHSLSFLAFVLAVIGLAHNRK